MAFKKKHHSSTLVAITGKFGVRTTIATFALIVLNFVSLTAFLAVAVKGMVRHLLAFFC